MPCCWAAAAPGAPPLLLSGRGSRARKSAAFHSWLMAVRVTFRSSYSPWHHDFQNSWC